MAFITFGIVIATFSGPPIVAYATLKHFQKVMRMDRSAGHAVSTGTMASLLVAPWALGLILALVVASEGKLGSFRGLYCYVNDFAAMSTGGATLILLLCGCILTAVLHFQVYSLVRSASGDGGTAHKAVMARGFKLIAALFLTWATFAVSGFMNLIGLAPPIWMESMGGLMVTFQPLIDAYMILATPSIKKAMLVRLGGGKVKSLNTTGRRTTVGQSENTSSYAPDRASGKVSNKVVAPVGGGRTVQVEPAKV